MSINLVQGQNCIIGNNVSFGDYVTLGHNCIIEDDVVIGNHSYIDSNTIIRSHVARPCAPGTTRATWPRAARMCGTSSGAA